MNEHKKSSLLSFPQAERVGNPSENESRKLSGQTSRNDKMTIYVALLTVVLVN